MIDVLKTRGIWVLVVFIEQVQHILSCLTQVVLSRDLWEVCLVWDKNVFQTLHSDIVLGKYNSKLL